MSPKSEGKRHLDLEGAFNVRDVGGYRTADGRRTRWKTFLRADGLHRLSPSSQAALIDYGMRTVIDLRAAGELELQPNVFAGSPRVVYHHQSLDGEVPRSEIPDYEATRDPMLVEMLAEVAESPADGEVPQRIRSSTLRTLGSYGGRIDRQGPQIRETLATLAEPGTLPALVHCAAGTDRTGIISAVVLGIAGVPAETIAADYALSGRYLLERDIDDGTRPEVFDGEYTPERYEQQYSPPEAMLAVLRYVDRRYRGIDGYVRTIGLDGNQIKSLRDAIIE